MSETNKSWNSVEDLSAPEVFGYFNRRSIDGVEYALEYYLFTVGLVCGIDDRAQTYERRYCYPNLESAKQGFDAWDGKDHPPGNWIKCKGLYKGQAVDLINPAMDAQ